MVGIVTDVTDRKQRERELRRKNARLDEFASLVSHDLRNPLTEAMGRLELVEAECESDHVAPIAAALARMETIVEDTLTLARQGDTVGETERIPIAPLVQECWRVVNSAEATIEVEDEFAVRGDPDRVRHVFENLFRNAIEHGGDDVTVRVGRSGPDEMYVEDDGPGIPAEQRTTAFDPGHTSLEAGSGLGLTIVERIVEAHDWTIRVTDGSDGGARFEIGGVDVE
jgi:signal transduction histidine kinase